MLRLALALIVSGVMTGIAAAQCAVETDGECAGSGLGQTYMIVNKSPDRTFRCTVAIKKNGATYETRVDFVAPGQRKILGCSQGGISRSDLFSFELIKSEER